MVFKAGTAARVLPSAALAAAVCGLTWLETGSTIGADWLPYAFLAALLLAVVLLSGDSVGLRPRELVALGALILLGGWAALSISWSAVPPLARDEAFLTLFYAIALVLPLLTLRTPLERLAATGTVAAASGFLAVLTAFALRFGSDQADHFFDGNRLSFPISYPNAQAAVFLIGFWPAVVLAARRESSPLVRSLALAAAAASSAGWLLAQSKGGLVGIAVSAALLFALSPARLRLLVPVLLVAVSTSVVYDPLTAPYRSNNQSELVSAVKHAGTTVLVLTVIAAAIGLAYALVDRRLALSARVRRGLGIGTLALFLAAVAAVVAVFLIRVDHPAGWFQDKWQAFKAPGTSQTSSHLLQLGSYRYDMWRVAIHEFESHPLAGIGSRGFGPAYLQHRHSSDTPARAHSFEFDALSELGIVGFGLLGLTLVPLVVPLVSRTRAVDPAATAALAGAAYFLVHASVDWIWTVPACGVPFFLLLGAGGSGGERRALRPHVAVPGAVAAVLVALVLFVPPWLSARLTAHGDFRWAKRLDPLSVDPYVAEAARAPTPTAAAATLAEAVRKQPRVVELRFDLGLAYRRAHQLRQARAELLEALRLDPREPRIKEALKSLPQRSIRSSR
jgi:O-antigen ligase